MDLNKVVRAYIKLRDTLTAERREFEERERALKDRMKVLENAMLQHLNDTKVESLRTSQGTVYRTKEIIPSGSDWDAFYAWIAKNNEFEALERRIKRTFIKDYMDANDGALPPGVSVHSEFVARVRRPT